MIRISPSQLLLSVSFLTTPASTIYELTIYDGGLFVDRMQLLFNGQLSLWETVSSAQASNTFPALRLPILDSCDVVSMTFRII
jgi:hypothetical protein